MTRVTPKTGFDARSLRPTSTAQSFPWLARLVTLVRVGQDGAVSQAKTEAEKRTMLGEAGDRDLLLAAWPGEWSQDVFVVDDLVGARLAIGLPRKQVPVRVAEAEVAPPEPAQPIDRPTYVAPGQLWHRLAELPTLPIEGQRHLAARFADRGPDEAAIAFLRRSDLDPSVRRLFLASVSSWRAAPLIANGGCTASEALALLNRFPTSASVIEAALRRPDTKDAARDMIAQLPYVDAAKLWLDSNVWSPIPRQRPELADGVLHVVLTNDPPNPSASSGYEGADRYERSTIVRMLMEQLPEDRRREYLQNPEYCSLVQEALLAGTDLADDDLVSCLPEVLKQPDPIPADANPKLLQYVQRFPRLAELGGTPLRQAVAGLITAGWSPAQAARSGHWDGLLVAARVADDRDTIDALIHAAVFDRSQHPSEATTAAHWRDARRYELVDVLIGKAVISDAQIRYVLDRLPVHHIEELQESADKRSRLHRLCAQALQERRPTAPAVRRRAESPPKPELPTDDDLSAMADPQSVLCDLLRDRSQHRSIVVDHVLKSVYMKEDVAWRLPVQDLERHPHYGPRLAAKVAEICGSSAGRWQAFAQFWSQPTQLLAATLFKRLEAVPP